MLGRGVAGGLGALGAYGWALARGGDLGRARSLAFATVVGTQLFQVLDWRLKWRGAAGFPADPFLMGTTAFSWAALLATLHLPGLRRLFQFAPLGASGCALALGASFLGTALGRALAPRRPEALPPGGHGRAGAPGRVPAEAHTLLRSPPDARRLRTASAGGGDG